VTRIIAGSAGGRRIATPSGVDTRPTSDRVREAVFSAVEHELGTLSGRSFLDLYAGSGAVGLEALSRGAAAVTLVEQDRRVGRVIRANVAALGMDGVTVVVAPVERFLRSGRSVDARFDVVFLDPPYPLDNHRVVEVLTTLRDQRWLTNDALAVLERSARTPDLAWPDGFEAARSRRYGETRIWYGRVTQRDALDRDPGDVRHQRGA
jgi:16S rRNA (guanine966-N2)-methyltransferase